MLVASWSKRTELREIQATLEVSKLQRKGEAHIKSSGLLVRTSTVSPGLAELVCQDTCIRGLHFAVRRKL